MQSALHRGNLVAVSTVVLTILFFSYFYLEPLSRIYSLGQDEGVNLMSARMVVHGHSLYSDIFHSHVPLFVESLALAFHLFGDNILTARGFAAFNSILALTCVARISWIMFGASVSPCAVILLGLSPSFALTTMTVQAEMHGLSLALLSMLLVLEPKLRHSNIASSAAGALFASAFLSSPLLGAMLFPLLLGIFHSKAKASPRTFQENIQTAFWFFFGLTATSVFLLSAYELSSFHLQVVQFNCEASSSIPSYRESFWQVARRCGADNAGLLFLALIGSIFLVRKGSFLVIILWAWTAGTYTVLAVQRSSIQEHQLFIVPSLVLLAAANLLWISERISQTKSGYGWLYLFMLPFFTIGEDLRVRFVPDILISAKGRGLTSPDSRGPANTIGAYSRPGDFVISDRLISVYYAGRLTPPFLCDISKDRIERGYLNLNECLHFFDGVQVIFLEDDRLWNSQGLNEWIDSRFDRTELGSATLWTKKM